MVVLFPHSFVVDFRRTHSTPSNLRLANEKKYLTIRNRLLMIK